MRFHPDKALGRRLRGERGLFSRALALVAAGITLAGAIAAAATAGGLSPNPASWPGARERTSFWRSPVSR